MHPFFAQGVKKLRAVRVEGPKNSSSMPGFTTGKWADEHFFGSSTLTARSFEANWVKWWIVSVLKVLIKLCYFTTKYPILLFREWTVMHPKTFRIILIMSPKWGCNIIFTIELCTPVFKFLMHLLIYIGFI